MRARSIVQIGAPSLVAVAVWFVLGWMPSQSAAAENRHAVAQSELTVLSAQLTDARALQAELATFADEIRAAEAAVPADRSVADFVRSAHAAAEASGVVLDQIAPLAVSSDTDPESAAPLPSGTSSISISVGVTGGYPGLMAFIDVVLNADRLVLVDSIEMRSDEADPTTVILDIEVRIFTTENLVSAPEFGFDEERFPPEAETEGAADATAEES